MEKERKIGEKQGASFKRSIKTIAATAAGAGFGVLGAIAGVTMAAVVLEVALPVSLCVWAGGVACGAVGLSLSVGKNKRGVANSVPSTLNQERAHPGSAPRAASETENRQKVTVPPEETKEGKRC